MIQYSDLASVVGDDNDPIAGRVVSVGSSHIEFVGVATVTGIFGGKLPSSNTDVNDFKEKMFDLGLNNEQAQAIANYQLNNFVDMIESFEQNNNEQLDVAEKELREIWKGDQFDYQMSKVADALDFLGLGEWKDDPKFANDPKFIRGIAENLLPLLDNDEIIQDVVFFPIPFENNLYFNSHQNLDISIYSVDGKLISVLKLQSKTGKVNLDFLEKGVYILKYFVEGVNYYKRIIKN